VTTGTPHSTDENLPITALPLYGERIKMGVDIACLPLTHALSRQETVFQ